MADFSAWIGRTRSAEETFSPRPAELLASLLPKPPGIGADVPVPPLWHWLYFPEIVPLSRTGSDGHPERGDFLPPVALPRRMWAGGELRFHAPLHFGQAVQRDTRIANITEKSGKSGKLCFVTLEHRLSSGGILAIEERQDIVYREDSTGPAKTPNPLPLEPAGYRETITPTPVMLFRYSAATTNSHRIHYDRSYATEVEGYAGLVVHGPLTATLLADLAQRSAGRALAGFRFRGQRPILDTAPFTIAADQNGDTVSLRAETPEGHIGMSAEAMLT